MNADIVNGAPVTLAQAGSTLGIATLSEGRSAKAGSCMFLIILDTPLPDDLPELTITVAGHGGVTFAPPRFPVALVLDESGGLRDCTPGC